MANGHGRCNCMKKKLFILMVLATCVGIVVYQMTIAAVKESRLIPGGCVVDERCPRYRCNDCSYKWGSYR